MRQLICAIPVRIEVNCTIPVYTGQWCTKSVQFVIARYRYRVNVYPYGKNRDCTIPLRADGVRNRCGL